jgi:N-acetylglucosamine-6-phosphate deacetylase
MREALVGAKIFDGSRLLDGHALVLEDGRLSGIVPAGQVGRSATARRFSGGVIAPGFIDLQVNGGGGVMIDGAATLETLETVCAAHRRLGAAGILPTLITDTPDATRAVIAAGIQAASVRLPGFMGLHLEGPHLDLHRSGAHDPDLIRPMRDEDLAMYLGAVRALPTLMITLAPEAVTASQVSALASAGVIVSLGHSDCTFETACDYVRAGARMATHLFNAMSGLGHRTPGLAGAVLSGKLASGLIADGIHVHPAAMAVALAARRSGLFLVSDAMAVAGTSMTEFRLNGRRILRRNGRLTLADGTLAGADLTIARAIEVLVGSAGLPLRRALAMATSIPAGAIRKTRGQGRLRAGDAADLVWLDPDLKLRGRYAEGRLEGILA